MMRRKHLDKKQLLLFRKNIKLCVIHKIHQFRNVLFNEDDKNITRDDRQNGWLEVFSYALSIGFITPDARRDWRFLRNVFWQNMKRSTLTKVEHYKNSGYMDSYCEKMGEVDYLILEILSLDDELAKLPPNPFRNHHRSSSSNENDDEDDYKRGDFTPAYSNDEADAVEIAEQEDNNSIVEQKVFPNHLEEEHENEYAFEPSEPKKKRRGRPPNKVLLNQMQMIQPWLHHPLPENIMEQNMAEDETSQNQEPIGVDTEMEDLKKHYMQLKVRKMQLEILKLERELGIAASSSSS